MADKYCPEHGPADPARTSCPHCGSRLGPRISCRHGVLEYRHECRAYVCTTCGAHIEDLDQSWTDEQQFANQIWDFDHIETPGDSNKPFAHVFEGEDGETVQIRPEVRVYGPRRAWVRRTARKIWSALRRIFTRSRGGQP